MLRTKLLAAAVLFALLAAPVSAFAQDGLTVAVAVSQTCTTASFDAQVSGGLAPYSLEWVFGDGEVQTDSGVSAFPFVTSHDYGAAGEFAWTLTASDSTDPALTGQAGGTIVIGPTVELTADVFPPLLTLEGGAATLNFAALVTGGEGPFTYEWDLDGDGVFEPGADTASFTYTAGGKYAAAVRVTDACGLTATAVLTVMVDDPLAEACHPMAERIADAVNMLFPTQAEQFYTCEEILAIFQGSLTGHNLGFGRMWHAVKLAGTLEDMTWEEILQWHLNQGGWGLLLQLDRFAETLGDVGPGELVEMVLAGDATVGELRTALRMTTRYDADFVEALALVHAGGNAGEIGQMYRAAGELGLDVPAVQSYLDQGLSISELRHAGRVAEQNSVELDLAVQSHLDGLSWGEIHRTIHLAGDEEELQLMLETEGQTRQEERRQEREADQAEQQLGQDARTAARLARRYGVSVAEVQALFDGSCTGDWACVQAQLQVLYPRTGKGHGRGNGH